MSVGILAYKRKDPASNCPKIVVMKEDQTVEGCKEPMKIDQFKHKRVRASVFILAQLAKLWFVKEQIEEFIHL